MTPHRIGNVVAAPPQRAPSSLLRGLAWSLVLSVTLTLVLAWPVVRSPRTMVFGREIAGRHHDPFTVMQQFESGGAAAPYRQPVTDAVGASLTFSMEAMREFTRICLAIHRA